MSCTCELPPFMEMAIVLLTLAVAALAYRVIRDDGVYTFAIQMLATEARHNIDMYIATAAIQQQLNDERYRELESRIR